MKQFLLIAMLACIASLSQVYASESKSKDFEKKISQEQSGGKKQDKGKNRKKKIVIFPSIAVKSIPPLVLPSDDTDE